MRLIAPVFLVASLLASALASAQQASPAPAPAAAPTVAGSPSQGSLPGDVYWGNTGVDPLRPSSHAPSSINDVLSDSMLRQKDQKDEIPWVRAQAIQEAAAAYGAQAGMAARARQLNEELRRNGSQYDRVFNFSAVMLEPGFLPPVISEGRDAYNQPNDFQVRAADRLYKIEFPARLVNVPPRWQAYLFVAESNAQLPDRASLPKSKAERELWDQWAARGWEQGQALAEETFRANMGRLKRDFEGMLRYKTLYAQGLVTKPVLARSVLGVTGGGDEMAVGDRIYEVTDKAQLNPDQKKWSTPAPRTHVSDPKVQSPSRKP